MILTPALSQSVLPAPYPPLTAGQQFLCAMTGGCLSGRIASLDMASHQQIHDFPGAGEIVDVLNVCLSLYEQYGAVEQQGATEEAWRMTALERVRQIPGGEECALFCLRLWDDLTPREAIEREEIIHE